jgi:hypothetical protein
MICHDAWSRASRAGLLASVVALLMAVAPSVSQARPSEEPFEIIPNSFHVTPSTYQAGAHEDLTTEFDFAHDKNGHTFNDVRTIVVNLPPGFNGNNTAVPTCTFAQLLAKGSNEGYPAGNSSAHNECPIASQIGTITFDLTDLNSAAPVQRDTFPVYNMETTSFGVTAEFAYKAVYITGVLLVSVRPGDSGLTVTSPNIEQLGEPHAISVTIWGVPAAQVHDPERGMECFADGGGGRPNPHGGAECFEGGESANIPAKPFLSNPTSCGPHTATIRVDSWEHPTEWLEASDEIGAIGECERVPFDSSIEAQPTTNAAESPSGLDVALVVPQSWEDPYTIATANLENTKVTLPVGYTVNPSAGNGLVGCTPAQYEAETSSSPPGAGCPAESKLGKVDIETPVLAERIKGNVYLAEPYDNRPEFGSPEHPNGSLLAMYVVAKAPDRGIIIKAAGKVEPNSVTGQLVTTFENTPQQPFNRFTLELKQGATSPLVSPPVCGTYTVLAEQTPWSAPSESRSMSNSFQIEKGIGGGPCPAGGVPPFKPAVISGTQDNDAGNYTPFYLRIVRNDGEQEITKFTTILPPGLTANLTGIPFCSDAQIQAAREATGQQEINSPSCPVASEIGHTLVGAGVGSVLAWTPGKVYLAGPYHGSALSIVSVTSATVGPFDLGTVVIRFALRINPTTGQAEIDSTGSDPIPHIIDGIVVHVRDIHVYVDRSKFMLDPTSCEHLSISNTITGAGADPANPADQQTVNVTTPFQAADCSSLGFKPSFKVTTSGKTSRQQGASLHVTLSYPNAPQGTQADIHSVKVDLPKQLPSRLTTLQKACVDSVFNANPAACPAASRVGTAKAITPILPVPIEGPAYFVSHGGAKFPELIIVLQGYGVTIDLHGETFINKEGVTSSTFRSVPDEPVTSFELTLPQGTDSALAANGNLCSIATTVTVKKKETVKIHGRKIVTRKAKQTVPGSLVMPTAFTAQNGAVIRQNTPITVTGCGKAKKAKTSQRGKPHGGSGGKG